MSIVDTFYRPSPMSDEALSALRKSIQHWEEVMENPGGASIGADSCALCLQFNPYITNRDLVAAVEDRNSGANENCQRCPIAQKTGQAFCGDTPYYTYVGKRWTATVEELRAAAQSEVDFLKSLLP